MALAVMCSLNSSIAHAILTSAISLVGSTTLDRKHVWSKTYLC